MLKLLMPWTITFAVAASILGAEAPAAPLESVNGPPPREWKGTQPPPASFQSLRTYAACIVKFRSQVAADFVTALPGTPRQREVAGDLFRHGYCIQKGALRTDEQRLRGALAEALLQRKPRISAKSPFGAEEDYRSFEAKIRAEKRNEWEDEDEQALVHGWLGYCVTREDFGGVEGLLKAEPDSPAEAKQMESLSGSIRGCMPKGGPVQVSRPKMRLLLAEALFLRKSGAK